MSFYGLEDPKIYPKNPGLEPYNPILFGWEPEKSYSREGSGFLGIGRLCLNLVSKKKRKIRSEPPPPPKKKTKKTGIILMK